MITENPRLNEYKSQIRIDVTPDGLQIQIVDNQNRPMFDSGSALVKLYMRDILREIGAALGGVENRIIAWLATPTPRPMATATGATATGNCRQTAPMPRDVSWFLQACQTLNWAGL